MQYSLLNAFLVTLVGGSLQIAHAQNQVNIYEEEGSARDTVFVPPDRAGDAIEGDRVEADPRWDADTVGSIEPSDVHKLERRRVARSYSTAGLGPAAFGDVGERQPVYSGYLGRTWEPNSRAAVKFNVEAASDVEDQHFVGGSLGANLFAMPTDFTPYVGGELGLGNQWTGDQGQTFGFTAGGSLGMALFRTATVQMNLEGNAKILMARLDDDDMPSVYSLRLGVAF